MRRPLTALALLASATAAAPTPAAPQTLAITNVNVVDVGVGVVRPGMTVVVSGDRITALGPSGSVGVARDARVVDGTGRFLIPGLWDMHVHTGSDRNTREIIYPLLVAHGVTGMRNMMGDCFDCGPVDFAIDQVNARRRAVAAGEFLGPRVVVSSAFAGSHEQAARRSSEGSSPHAPGTEADARAFVRLAKDRGADFIKVYDMLPRGAYFALAEEADRLGLPIAGHVPVAVRASEASDAGQRSIEHLGMGNVLEECSSRESELRARVIAELEKAEMGSRHTADGPALLPLVLEMVGSYDPAKCAALASRFLRNGTWFVPTLMTSRLPSELGTGWRQDPYARFLPPDERRFFEMAEDAYTSDLGDAEDLAPVFRWAREVTRAMHRAGVRMLAGSDAGFTGIFWGIGLHQELELLVSTGLPDAEALRAATLAPAQFLEATDSLGTIESGKLADLVLLEANPLDDIANTQQIAAVVLRGRYLRREALDTLLTEAERAAQSRDVVIEGDSKGVELRSADHAMLDMGTANRVTRPAGTRESGAPPQAAQAATAQDWTDASPHEIRYVTVAPDVRLEILDWGGDGLPLVFLAGANFNAHSFDDFAPRFTDTHRVLGITRRGHGNSSWPDSGYDLPTLVEDIRVVLDSLGIERAILAGHSWAGSEMTVLATDYPDRIAGLIYIDAGHDPSDISRLRVPELCSFGPGFREAMERTFENPELVRRTQWFTDENGARRPFASAAAARIDLPTPEYSGVVAPALGIYYVPERTEDVFMGVGDPSPGCVAAFHRYIHGGIAAFTEGVEQATVIPLSDTNHNIHLASPAALEAIVRQWLDSHAAPDPTDRLVREHMQALGIPAVSLVVMRNGVVLREAAYGRPSLELDMTATSATVFPYASMAKVFTGTAVLRLVQGGRLSLDGRITDLLPDLPTTWSDVTVRQLLAHTSGLPDLNSERGFQNPFVSPWASRAAALEALAGLPFERAPGTGFSYNQTNYLLLGMLLERIDGRTVEEYVAEEIAGPLGLASLAYGDSRVPIAGRASWYSRMDFSEGEPRVVAPRPLWIEYPPFQHTAAGLNGTAGDLARFVDAVASGRMLDDAHRHEMWTAVPLADGSTLRFENGVTGAGLGWWVHDDPAHPWVGMGGAASGVVRHHVNEGLTIAVLTNLQGAEPEALASAIAEIYVRVDTVHVAPPTGEKEIDRASILAALERVQPDGTVQFASGTYTVGELVRVTVPGITLLGHPDGTTLRGCDPVEFSDVAVAMAGLDMQETLQTVAGLVVRCNGLDLTGERQTVRGLTFEHTWHALTVGCCPESGELAEPPLAGGHLIEGNTFRASINGFRVTGDLPEPVVIRDNDFINVWHAGVVNGRTAHILDNRVSVPDPRHVPVNGYPGLAFAVSPHHPTQLDKAFACTGNVIAGNEIEGHPEGIAIFVFGGRAGCSDNAIRDNTIRVSRVRFTGPSWGVIGITNEADSTLAGVSITLADLSVEMADVFGLPASPPGEALIHDNVVQGNRIVGGEGLGIEILRASRNRIVGNTITGITIRDPFPGNTMYVPPAWGESNGSGIWISDGSTGNEIADNTFVDVAGAAVLIEGDSNRVELRSASDSLRVLGSGNIVSGPSDSSGRPSAGGAGASPDTTRYVEVVDGHVLGGWRTWLEDGGTRGYASDRYFEFERTDRLTLDEAGLPVRLESSGQIDDGVPWFERFERTDGMSRWLTPVGRDSAVVSGPAFYAAIYPAHDLGVLARALLARPSRSLPLLPSGQASVETLTERRVEMDGHGRVVRLYAIQGLDLLPRYVWLDESGATFADEWSVLEGWEHAFGQLRAEVDDALADHFRALAARLAPVTRSAPLAIRGAALFDPATRRVNRGTTIVIDGDRIAAVEPDAAVDLPAGAEVIDAAGRTILPGLWDMHAHLRIPAEPDRFYDQGGELLHLAAGVTTVRDMGSRVQSLVALRSAIDRGDAIGPRIIGAGYIDGADVPNDGVGFYVKTAEEATAAVTRYAELGFPQIKVYASLPPDLLPVVIARAEEHGMRVSGHITPYLTTREAVEAGYDEIQHIWWLLWSIPWTNDQSIAAGEDRETSHQVLAAMTPDSKPVRETVALLADHGTAVDVNLGYFVSESSPPENIAAAVDRLPLPVARRVRHQVVQPNYFPRSPLARPAREQALANMFALLPVLHEAGVPLMIGTDNWPGFGLHHEMEIFVRAGIPAPDVIALATLGAARVMGVDHELGSIETGKLADLILVDGDPTTSISDIRRVVTVIRDGRVYDPAAIYRALGIEPCCAIPENGGLLAGTQQAANRPPEAAPEVLDPGNRSLADEQGSIAVLPFADMSPAQDEEYLSDGIAEELQDVLAQLPELRVAFRTSAFAFKGKDVAIDSIARALNVRHVLEGSVLKAGDQMRITTRLIDASTGDHLWSETYDRELKDVFQVQDEIAREIVHQLQLELGGARAGAVLAKEETKDPEAHVLLLRGRRLYRQYTREGFEEAEALLKQAIARDPTYARAHADLASVYHNQADQRHGPIEALMAQARAALERALEMDPNLARAHYVAGRMAYGSGHWHAAEASVARAVELNPGYVPAHALRAYLLAVLGRTEEAITAAKRAVGLDPVSPNRQTDVADTYVYTRQYERAAEAYQSAVALDPGSPSNLGNLGFVYALMGRHAEAVRVAERARDLAPQEQWPLTALGYAYARAGRRAEAEAVLRTLEAQPQPDPYLRAIVYAGIGERDRVFSLLEQAVAERNALVEGLGVDPVFDPYRSDPRMERLLKRLGLAADSR